MTLIFKETFLNKINSIYNCGVPHQNQYTLRAETHQQDPFNDFYETDKSPLCKVRGMYGSGLNSAGRALITWLENSQRTCTIYLEEGYPIDAAEATHAGGDEEEKASRGEPCNTIIRANTTCKLDVLAHEMIHAFHFMDDPWNEQKRVGNFTYIMEPCRIIGEEEARTVGLGTYDVNWLQANPKIITENMIRRDNGDNPRTVY